MFQALKPVSKKETMGSYSIAVIGIILITVIITLGLSVLGVGIRAQDGIQDHEMPYIPEKKPMTEMISHKIPPEIKISEDQSIEINSVVSDGAIVGLCDVSVPKNLDFGPFDTVRGTLTVFEEVLPTVDKLPLCIDPSWFDPYYVIVRSYGGYSPVCGGFDVDQLKDDVIEGHIYMRFVEVTDEYKTENDCCAVTYWKITFYTCEPICLDSNHTPEGFCDKTLGKEVYLDGCMTWTGCISPDQYFSVILAHKAMSQNQNPKLPIFIAS